MSDTPETSASSESDAIDDAIVDIGGGAGDLSPRPRVLVAESARIMATEIGVQLAAPPEREAAARAAAQSCMAFFAEVDERLSRFKPESELSRMNRGAGTWFAASDLLYACVELALDAARQTDGLFDPTLLYAIEALGYDRDFAEIARHEAPRSAPTSGGRDVSAVGGWRAIVLDRARRRIRLPEGVGLDLGGIAKGWAADVAFERFCVSFPGVLINLGGDLRLHGGPQPGQAWSVGIRDPRDELVPGEPRYAALITCSRGGLATSGAPARWWLQGGHLRHHLLDPRTGWPMRLWTSGASGRAGGRDAGDEQASDAKPIATATALAPSATQAEVAAKVALLRGRQAALRAVEHAWGQLERSGLDAPSDPPSSMDADVALLLTYGDGEVALSRTMRPYLATWGTQGASVPLRIGGTAGRAGLRPLDG